MNIVARDSQFVGQKGTAMDRSPPVTRLLVRSVILGLMIAFLMNVIRSNPDLLVMYQ